MDNSEILPINMASKSSIDHEVIPVTALNCNFRKKLGLYLNPQNTVAADWRTVAEMMDFTYLEIKNFEKRDYPFEKVLTEWETRPEATVANLLSILEKAERKDVISDLKEIIGMSSTFYVTLYYIFILFYNIYVM